MSLELIYTSAPSGLKPGAKGFCTVLMTQGMPPGLVGRLEMLSAYRHMFPPQDPRANQNPTGYSHVKLKVSGQPISIISRVSAYGVDYSGRTNKFAHHVVLQPSELVHAGPASLLQDQRIMRQSWEGAPQSPATGPVIPQLERNAAICDSWQRLSGDAGWGGVVAEALSKPTGKPKWIIYSLAQQEQMLRLLEESIALLPVPAKWNATFSTYYTNLPPEADCFLRCVPAGSDEARTVSPRDCIINLTSPAALTHQSEWVDAARSGRIVGVSQAALASVTHSLDSSQAFFGDVAVTAAKSGPVVLPTNARGEVKLPSANYDVHEDWPFQPSEIIIPSTPPPPSVINNRAEAYETSDGSSLKPVLFAVTGALLLLLLIGGWFIYTNVNKPVAANPKEQETVPVVEQVETTTPQEAGEPAATKLDQEPATAEPGRVAPSGMTAEESFVNPSQPDGKSVVEDATIAPRSTEQSSQASKSDPELKADAVKTPESDSDLKELRTLPTPDTATAPPLDPSPDPQVASPNKVDSHDSPENHASRNPDPSLKVEASLDGTELFLELQSSEDYKLIGSRHFRVDGVTDKTQFNWTNEIHSFGPYDLERNKTTSNLLSKATLLFQLKIGTSDDNINNANLSIVFSLKSQATPRIPDTEDLTNAFKKILLNLNGFTEQVKKLRELNANNIEYIGKDDDSERAWIEFKEALSSFVQSEMRNPGLKTGLDSGSNELKERLLKVKAKSTQLSKHVDEINKAIGLLQTNAATVRDEINKINELPKIKLGDLYTLNRPGGIMNSKEGTVKSNPIEVTVRIKVDEQGTN